MKFGDKLQLLRKSKQLSQENLANRLNVSRQAISKWELNSSVPDTENVVKICELFGVSADYLLSDSYENDKDIPAIQKTYNKIRTFYNKRILAMVLIFMGILGIIISFILTLNVQSMEMEKHGSFYTNELNYILEAPLIYLFGFSMLCIIIGIIFLIRDIRKCNIGIK